MLRPWRWQFQRRNGDKASSLIYPNFVHDANLKFEKVTFKWRKRLKWTEKEVAEWNKTNLCVLIWKRTRRKMVKFNREKIFFFFFLFHGESLWGFLKLELLNIHDLWGDFSFLAEYLSNFCWILNKFCIICERGTMKTAIFQSTHFPHSFSFHWFIINEEKSCGNWANIFQQHHGMIVQVREFLDV